MAGPYEKFKPATPADHEPKPPILVNMFGYILLLLGVFAVIQIGIRVWDASHRSVKEAARIAEEAKKEAGIPPVNEMIKDSESV